MSASGLPEHFDLLALPEALATRHHRGIIQKPTETILAAAAARQPSEVCRVSGRNGGQFWRSLAKPPLLTPEFCPYSRLASEKLSGSLAVLFVICITVCRIERRNMNPCVLRDNRVAIKRIALVVTIAARQCERAECEHPREKGLEAHRTQLDPEKIRQFLGPNE